MCLEGDEQLKEDDAERVDVDFVVVALERELLWRHVELGADLANRKNAFLIRFYLEGTKAYWGA